MGANPMRKRKRKPAVRHSQLPAAATDPVRPDELDFNPDVEPLVTQLLNRDPQLVYPAHINPILGSVDEPQFRLGLSRREKKELETLREVHEEKMAERNIPLDEQAYLALNAAAGINSGGQPAATGVRTPPQSPSFWAQPLDNVVTAYQSRTAPQAEQLLIAVRIAQKEANGRAAQAAAAALQAALRDEVTRYATEGGAYREYEHALGAASIEMDYGPACCCNRHRWFPELPTGAGSRHEAAAISAALSQWAGVLDSDTAAMIEGLDVEMEEVL